MLMMVRCMTCGKQVYIGQHICPAEPPLVLFAPEANLSLGPKARPVDEYYATLHEGYSPSHTRELRRHMDQSMIHRDMADCIIGVGPKPIGPG